ncbi:hypothetical protein B0O99DRAFT_97779 [Bisporella sp. PMI_857]|nr:hypothetical protein B0O99DRAFT_97779 [Bisporella sp. PMI_857]
MDANRPSKSLKLSGRRTHRKSRNGCRYCKLRKIKCGEEKPSCINCISRSIACEFASPACVSDSAFLNATGNTLPFGIYMPQLPHLNTLDLELLHNYSISTCLSISNNAAMEAYWRIEVPQIGFSNAYVMRSILAISALHLARLYPEKGNIFIPYSVQQHEAALREATAILPNITTDNCVALHLLSVFSCVYNLGSPRKAASFLVDGSGLSEWLSLFRGIKAIVDSAPEAIYTGSLAPLLQAGHKRLLLRETYLAGGMRLDELRHLILGTTNNGPRSEIYIQVIEDLEKSFSVVYGSPPGTCEAADVFTWYINLPEDYLVSLQEGAQAALAIFAYSCVLFQKLEFFWWMEGWSVHFVSQIYDLLDEEHRSWIRWPIDLIRWVPH